MLSAPLEPECRAFELHPVIINPPAMLVRQSTRLLRHQNGDIAIEKIQKHVLRASGITPDTWDGESSDLRTNILGQKLPS
jgi:hypothetical protein